MRFIFSIGLFYIIFLTVDIKSSCCITDSDLFLWLCPVCHSMYWNLGLQAEHTHLNSSSPALYSRNSWVQESWPSLCCTLTLLAPQSEDDLRRAWLSMAWSKHVILARPRWWWPERARCKQFRNCWWHYVNWWLSGFRANTALQTALPGAQINAQVSVTTKTANEIMLNNSQNKFFT